jgi:hypothetical protein
MGWAPFCKTFLDILNKIKNIKKVYSSSKEETGMGEE